MAKQKTCQRFIMKINSSRLRRAKWNLTLPLIEARKNDEIISLSDSQMLRFIDEINGIVDADDTAKKIKSEIKKLKKLPHSVKNKREIRSLYEKLDSIQFKPDYMCLVIDKDRDFKIACEGFYINGIKYVRLLGTNGGVKTRTIVFVSERIYDELNKRINNGRDESVNLVPAKFEAYRALTCSGSIPVSMPNGILVVNDCETSFREDIIYLNDENVDEPVMEYRENETVELDESDGYGLMMPSLAERWSEELGLDYIVGGVNTRYCWEKGMVFCFDFVRFADEVAHNRIVKDAWGNDVDVSNVELILTTSMLKLWDSYDSLDDFLKNCNENKYTFGITKTCPKELENERDLNYQFIQSYRLSDEQIEELIQPTIDEIKDILALDYRKTILFLKGIYLNEDNIEKIETNYSKALMIDEKMIDDPFVQKKVYGMIKNRIDEAKVGVIKVRGNYSIISGDPYSLCQSIFGLEVTGILKKGEIYSRFWVDRGVDKVACFRAPMTCHNNIKAMKVCSSEEAVDWYRYMNACTILNSWDSTAHALNGADKDGDLMLTTDNRILVDNIRNEPTIMCVQRRASKIPITEKALMESNAQSFGDDIGKTTNWITSMFDVQSQFDVDSEEYKVLDYRIKCGQLYQQNAIDKAKGIISNPMPKEWHDLHSAKNSDPSKQDLNVRIVADKKPYFMVYIYPSLMSQYTTYIKNTRKKALREFRRTLDDLLKSPVEELSEKENVFVNNYKKYIPVSTNDCIMNKICRRFEKEFDGFFSKQLTPSKFDYEILKDNSAEYVLSHYKEIQKLYKEHNKKMREFMQISKAERIDPDVARSQKNLTVENFRRDCVQVCSNESQLCNIILDICYRKSGSKQFAWDICADVMVGNLLKKNDYKFMYPVLDPNGDIEFRGMKFSFVCKEELPYDESSDE